MTTQYKLSGPYIQNLDQLIEKFLTDQEFRTAKFNNSLVKLREFAIQSNLDELAFITGLSHLFINTDNDLMYNIKMYINNGDYCDYPYQIMNICFDKNHNKFSDLITNDFIRSVVTVVYDNGLYYNIEFINYFFGYTYDNKKENMLIEIFKRCNFEPNMMTDQNLEFTRNLLIEAGISQYYNFMHLLLDKGAKIKRNHYVIHTTTDYLFHYNDVYKLILDYYNKQNNTNMTKWIIEKRE